MKVIGVGGGSGAGKTAACNVLATNYPHEFQVVHLDDYHMDPGPNLPRVDTMINWEDPGVVAWQALRQDLTALRGAQSVERRVRTRDAHSDRPKQMLQPRPVVIVEGHLALSDCILDVYDYAVYLDAGPETRAQRRREARGGKDTLSGDNRYADMVLKPMHEIHIEPTKENADMIIDAGASTAVQIAGLIRNEMLLWTSPGATT
jgi:uridine kinase